MLAEMGGLLGSLLSGLLGAVMTCGFRVTPRLHCKDFGIDTWYYLTYARALKRNRQQPVTLPSYLLDDPQPAYPPALPWLLSWLPTRWLERSHWWLSAAIDTLHCVLLCSVVWAVSHSWIAVGGAGLLFATSPVLVSQATELNTRPAGTLVLTVFMLSLWVFEHAAGWVTAAAVLATGTMILWTHKMTAQQAVVVLLGWSLMHRDLRYLLFGLGMVGLGLVLSHGRVLNVLRGHWEIIRFWRTRLHLLGTHQVYDSPLYANPEKAKQKRGVSGVRASRLSRWLALAHLAGIVAALAWIGGTGIVAWASFPGFLLRWTGLVFLTALATTWVPGLTQFGEGFKYLRYGVFPWSCLLGFWGVQQGGWIGWGVLIGLLGVQVLVTCRILQAQAHNLLATLDEDTKVALRELALQPEDGVLALPVSRCEAIAYFCEKRVLWGAHGRGWERIEPFYPVLRKPIESFLEAYHLQWLWIDTRYVDMTDLRLAPAGLELWLQRGPVQLFRYAPERERLSKSLDGAGTCERV